jgi:choline-sulfatase
MNETSASRRRPNILLIMTDQQRFDQIGYASNGAFDTPHLDRLAHRGTIFENAYSTSTVCVPARCSLLTGLLHHRVPTQNQGEFGFLALREGFWTIPRYLRTAGYRTALIGKMHFYPIRASHGFDHMQTCEHLTEHAGYGPGDIDDYHVWLMWNGRADWRGTHMFGPGQGQQAAEYRKNGHVQSFPYEARYHPTNWVAAQTVKFLRERRADEPFFLVSSFRHPHTPYDPPEPYASMYRPEDITLPEDGRSLNESLPEPFRSAMLAAPPHKEEHVRRVLAAIKALVKQIDDAVGEILKHVNLDDTYVFFTSDHGDYSGYRALLGKVPWYPFDDLARVPFFCAGPTVPHGLRIKDLVQNYDFAMTCLDLAGLPAPAPVFDAVSLRPYFDGSAVERERVMYCATTPALGCSMIRRQNLKYLRAGEDGPEMLFDLASDPAEARSVAGDPKYAESLADFRALLRQCMSREVPALPAYAS